jgi:hypothetical protein
MLGITKFELAIIEFGVKNAIEYFATPEEHHHLWDDNWLAEVKAKADEWYKLVGAKNTEQEKGAKK